MITVRECHLNVGCEQMHANLEIDKEEAQHMFPQAVKGVLSRDWLLLNNQNMVDQFIYPGYLKNINSIDKQEHVFVMQAVCQQIR